jgi:nicotinate-nucleotide adenylyltransferase
MDLKQQHPEAEWFFLLGGDSLADLPGWREPQRICQLATLVVVARPHAPPPDFGPLAPLVPPERIEHMQKHVVQMPLVELSSSDLRSRVSQGQSIRFRTPRAVEKYIETQGLYSDACT